MNDKNFNIAKSIYEELIQAGVEIGDASIPIIKRVLDNEIYEIDEWKSLALKGRRIDAIKKYRNQRGVTLRVAKADVDTFIMANT